MTTYFINQEFDSAIHQAIKNDDFDGIKQLLQHQKNFFNSHPKLIKDRRMEECLQDFEIHYEYHYYVAKITRKNNELAVQLNEALESLSLNTLYIVIELAGAALLMPNEFSWSPSTFTHLAKYTIDKLPSVNEICKNDQTELTPLSMVLSLGKEKGLYRLNAAKSRQVISEEQFKELKKSLNCVMTEICEYLINKGADIYQKFYYIPSTKTSASEYAISIHCEGPRIEMLKRGLCLDHVSKSSFNFIIERNFTSSIDSKIKKTNMNKWKNELERMQSDREVIFDYRSSALKLLNKQEHQVRLIEDIKTKSQNDEYIEAKFKMQALSSLSKIPAYVPGWQEARAAIIESLKLTSSIGPNQTPRIKIYEYCDNQEICALRLVDHHATFIKEETTSVVGESSEVLLGHC